MIYKQHTIEYLTESEIDDLVDDDYRYWSDADFALIDIPDDIIVDEPEFEPNQ